MNEPSIEQFTNIDAFAIITEWEQFKHYNFLGKIVFDGRNILENSNQIYQIGK